MGKANNATNALLQSRPNVAKSEESTKQEQQVDQDAAKQCDQAFAVISSIKIVESELTTFKKSEQANVVLMKQLALLAVELKHKSFELFPQGMLVKVGDNTRR